MREDQVLVEDDAGVRIVRLNRPEHLNALTPALMASFVDAIADAERDTAIGCVVVTGAGRGFCAGGDIRGGGDSQDIVAPNRQLGSRIEQRFAKLRANMDASRLLHEMSKPTIAMINGPVAGAGIGIAGACDLRFAGRSATFVTAFDKIGASGDFGSTWFLSKIVGTAVARELFLLGEKLSAEEAFAKGLYTRLFDDEALGAETLKVAHGLAGGPRTAYRYMKQNLNNAEDWPFEAQIEAEALNMTLSTQASALIRREQQK